jgi:hypothetical protein
MCWIVLAEMSAKPGNSPLTSLAVLKGWRRIKHHSLSSCAKFVFRGLPERFLGGGGVADSGRSLWIRMIFHTESAFPPSLSAISFGVTPSSYHAITLLFSASPNCLALGIVPEKKAPDPPTLEPDRRLSVCPNQLIPTVNSTFEQRRQKNMKKQLLKVVCVSRKIAPKVHNFSYFLNLFNPNSPVLKPHRQTKSYSRECFSIYFDEEYVWLYFLQFSSSKK